MVIPTQQDLRYLKGKYGEVIYAQEIRDIENGFDVEAYYKKCRKLLVPKQVILLGVLYLLYTIIGIVQSRKDCTEEYCYNVNQFLWVYYGCVSEFALFVSLIWTWFNVENGKMTEFRYYFTKAFSFSSEINYLSFGYIWLLCICIVVHIIYLSKTPYLQGVQIGIVLLNCCYMCPAFYYTRKMEQYYQEERDKNLVKAEVTHPIRPPVCDELTPLYSV